MLCASRKSPHRRGPAARCARSIPIAEPSEIGPRRSPAMAWDPSGRRTSPRRCNWPPSKMAKPAIGVSHEPSRARKKARSAARRWPVGVSWIASSICFIRGSSAAPFDADCALGNGWQHVFRINRRGRHVCAPQTFQTRAWQGTCIRPRRHAVSSAAFARCREIRPHSGQGDGSTAGRDAVARGANNGPVRQIARVDVRLGEMNASRTSSRGK